jgi:PAS domain S-box-containing protein
MTSLRSIWERRQRGSRAIARACAFTVAVIAATALAGWWLGAPVLRSWVTAFVGMNPVTALTFLAAAAALLAVAGGGRRLHGSAVTRLLGLIVVVLPLFCVSRLYLPWDLGPDRWLFSRKLAVPTDGFANRMAPVTAIAFVLLGTSLLLLTSRMRIVRRVALAIATLMALVALIVVVDYAYASSLAVVPGLIPVALNTAVAFIVSGVALHCARPGDGLAGLLLSRRVGSSIAIRLLPAALLVPLAIGWGELRGEQAGWFDTAGGAAIVSITTALILAGMIWKIGGSINRADRMRTLAERQVRNFNARLEVRVAERTHELRETQAQFQQKADELRGWFDASPLASCSLMPDSRVLSWNPAAEALFGWTASEVIGRSLPIVAADHALAAQQLNDQVLAGRPVTNLETQRMHKDGHAIDVTISTARLHDADGTPRGIVAVYGDIRERINLEGQLRQSQKLEAIGRLAGGVAHDFNNILMVIQSAAEFVLADLPEDDTRRQDVIDIADASHRAANLTRQLLAFSRQQVLNLRILDVNRVVETIEPMLRRLIGVDVSLVVRLGARLSSVKADSGQLDQVLMNLVVNARDAMPSGGTILIETAKVTLGDDFPRGHLTAGPGEHIMLSVMDTGSGMDAETQRQIFEPFFTTKALGQGTGLGLAMVYGIVKQLGGHIWVYSELGQGTTFKIYLPVCSEPDANAEVVIDESRGVTTVGATVLVVEDAAPVRASVRRMLERCEYHVLEASNGQDALDLLDSGTQPVDLVLSDMLMPGMTGRELRDRLVQQEGSPPVLLMSGYSAEAITRLGNSADIGAVLEKPFSVEQLVQKIEETLGAALPR